MKLSHGQVTEWEQTESPHRVVSNHIKGSDSKSRAIMMAMPDLMFCLSREFIHLDFHAPDLDSLYADPKDFMGRSVQDVLPADVAYIYLQHIRETLEKRRLQLFEYELAFSSQDRRYYEARMTPIDDDEVLVMVREITERKAAEEALRESEQKAKRAAEVTETIAKIGRWE